MDSARHSSRSSARSRRRFHVQTALQMASLAMRAGKVARFDAASERIIL
ncbi:MAG TPA: hypothetical protein PL151_00910 [Phycisphaerae bacterium]|nr:hypothetical protein [Phycisphaerae bacterium]HOJ72581.1 hypothetical protein [Phycisphaerae bacterium]HOM49758.1 hypothetical protein [Phycisphaerae bacterium]HON68724.1 hypothetical protein [Phycisphaerae bacterium]HOQ86749.1 hypothetical protein [Phycisphaerae bacterium]